MTHHRRRAAPIPKKRAPQQTIPSEKHSICCRSLQRSCAEASQWTHPRALLLRALVAREKCETQPPWNINREAACELWIVLSSTVRPGRLRLLRMLGRLPINFPTFGMHRVLAVGFLPKAGSALENPGQPASKVTGAQGRVVTHRHTHALRLVRETVSRVMRPRKSHTLKHFHLWAADNQTAQKPNAVPAAPCCASCAVLCLQSCEMCFLACRALPNSQTPRLPINRADKRLKGSSFLCEERHLACRA